MSLVPGYPGVNLTSTNSAYHTVTEEGKVAGTYDIPLRAGDDRGYDIIPCPSPPPLVLPPNSLSPKSLSLRRSCTRPSLEKTTDWIYRYYVTDRELVSGLFGLLGFVELFCLSPTQQHPRTNKKFTYTNLNENCTQVSPKLEVRTYTSCARAIEIYRRRVCNWDHS